MSSIKAGVVVINKFCPADSKAFSGYISYIDRSEAKRNEKSTRDELQKYINMREFEKLKDKELRENEKDKNKDKDKEMEQDHD